MTSYTFMSCNIRYQTLRGARGNSGVILSLLFRGISKKLKGAEECDGVLWAQALQEGVDAAYKAVMKPAEGTILTVSRLAAAKATQAARENNHIEYVQKAAIEEAKVALTNTVNQNPVLKKAGVVDAGGKGWLTVLEAIWSVLQGEDIVAPESTGEANEGGVFARRALTVVGTAHNDPSAKRFCAFRESGIANGKAKLGKFGNVRTIRQNFRTCWHDMVGCDIVPHL